MSDQETQMKIKFLGKEKKLNFINDYNKFLEKCYKLFKIDENKKKNLKIYVLDEDDESELAIDNESDFKDQQVINEENNTITYILKLEGTSETNENEQLSEHQNQDNDNENNDNKKNDDTFEGNKGGVVNNEDKKDENNECVNNIDFSKIIESFKEENKKFQNEIIEKINELLKNMAKELKTSMKKSLNDIKTFLMAIDEGMKKNHEENKEKNTNMEKELKKNVKKSICDVKTFLIAIDDGMKKNHEEIQNSIIGLSKLQNNNNNNDKKLDEFKNEIINQIKSIEESIKNNNKEFKNLENKFDRMKEDIRKQNQIQSKKQEKEEFYGCLFEDGNYILQYYYEDLKKLNPYKMNIKLLNNGNLSWPQNSILNIDSNDDFFTKQVTLNKDYEIQPNKNIKYELQIPMNNIKNENYEIKINMNLEFVDKSKYIHQNEFNLKFIIKQSKKEFNNSNINQNNFQSPMPSNIQNNSNINQNIYKSSIPSNIPNNSNINQFNNPQNNFSNDNFNMKNSFQNEKKNNFTPNDNNFNNFNNNNFNDRNRYNQEQINLNQNNLNNDDNLFKNINNNKNEEYDNNLEKVNPNNDDDFNILAQNKNIDPNNDYQLNGQNNISSPPKPKKDQNMNLNKNKGNNDNQIIDAIFQDIKQKLEEDYTISNIGWSDEELKNKIKTMLNNQIKDKLKSNKEDGISEIVELIGEELLSI